MDPPILSTVEASTDLVLSAYERAGALGLFIATQFIFIAVLLWLFLWFTKKLQRSDRESEMNADHVKAMFSEVEKLGSESRARDNNIERSVARVDERVEKLADRHEDPDAPFSTTKISTLHAVMSDNLAQLMADNNGLHKRIDRFLEHGDRRTHERDD